MKNKSLFSSGVAFLIAFILIGCGIFLPSTFLEWQESRILQSKHAFPIEPEELEQGEGNDANADLEYQELLYRLCVYEASTRYLGDYTVLTTVEEYELSRENAIEKSKQELLRLMDLGACPSELNLDDFVLKTAELQGSNSEPENWVREVVYLYFDMTKIDTSRRFSCWNITWGHKDEGKKDFINVDLDAQTGKIYRCSIRSSTETFDIEYQNFALMFGKYHDILEYYTKEWDNGMNCYFDQIEVFADLSYSEDPEDMFWYFYLSLHSTYF